MPRRLDAVLGAASLAPAPLLNPVADLKTLLPSYITIVGEFFWTALALDEFLFPDPTFAGLFPGITTSDSLIRTFDAGDLWNEANLDVDDWRELSTNPAAGANLALTDRGRFHGIAPDFTNLLNGAATAGAVVTIINATSFSYIAPGLTASGDVLDTGAQYAFSGASVRVESTDTGLDQTECMAGVDDGAAGGSEHAGSTSKRQDDREDQHATEQECPRTEMTGFCGDHGG